MHTWLNQQELLIITIDGMLRLVSNASNNVGFSIDATIFIFII
jgi:hypothetical protein